jgi:thiosulfate dehydrogenase [quinone] large subunit
LHEPHSTAAAPLPHASPTDSRLDHERTEADPLRHTAPTSNRNLKNRGSHASGTGSPLYASSILAAEPFDARGYLLYAVPNNGSPLADLYVAMGQTDWLVAFVNVAVPWGELLIGLALLVGAFTRLAAFFGALMMLLFYFGSWDIAHGVINGDFAYMLVFLAVAAFGAGRILGLDAWLETYEVGGQPLVERYPALDYVLG